jgi:hypothetical protein
VVGKRLAVLRFDDLQQLAQFLRQQPTHGEARALIWCEPLTAQHLTRLACLYVRQSTLQHVLENTENTARQYALRDRARALGWADERIAVIDQDLGHSGASTVDRLGFQREVA